MISATLTGLITTRFEKQISAIPLLVSFMPVVMGTGGNCGSQSSTLIIRGMALEEIKLKDFFRVIFKEFRIALICGAVLAVANAIRIYLQYRNIMLAVVVSLSLIFTIIIAKIVGGALPMVAKKVGLDPAIMSTPLITTIVDSASILIYFTLATHILHLAV
jgi:Mg/Co/Ni transporter MgtE (contains CBS domain)